MKTDHSFDVIVVGGGHAGCEAAAAAARMGANTLLVTHRYETIGEMSCNPAIGGVGKGTLVREIDALDGLMGKAIDRAGIHYKMLNRSKGPAVWGPRAQADRKLYKQAIQSLLKEHAGLTIWEDSVEDLWLNNTPAIQGVICQNLGKIRASAVVLTTGTFLNGLIHIGEKKIPAGRVGEAPAKGVVPTLRELGFPLGRLKTGTPARLDAKSIDWSKLEIQPGDEVPEPFSALTSSIHLPQLACYITYTGAATHDIIRSNLHRSAMYSGQISGTGPRYCPSIEDKIVKFADKGRHQIFLEPEGIDNEVVYPNGISTSLNEETQSAFIATIPGLEKVNIIRYGYAIEYDYINPQSLYSTLESKFVSGLFLSGQINGTTGYEEAGGQGILAGINAARYSVNLQGVHLSRGNSLIGVMVDDLIRDGADEPYRMFTSRSEFRLTIRPDNADMRLTDWGISLGVVSAKRAKAFGKKNKEIKELKADLVEFKISPKKLAQEGWEIAQDGVLRSAYQLLSYKGVDIKKLESLGVNSNIYSLVSQKHIEIEAKYQVFMERQSSEIELLASEERISIPADLNYDLISSLSNEMKARLKKAKPATVAEAKKLSGITPAAILALYIYLQKRRGDHASAA